MKLNKRTILLIAAAVILAGGLFICYFKKNIVPLQKATFEKYQKEYVNRSFYGTVEYVHRYTTGEHIVDLAIKDTSGEKIVYNKLSYSFQPYLVTFVAEGDSIMKTATEETVTVFKKDGNYKSFVLY